MDDFKTRQFGIKNNRFIFSWFFILILGILLGISVRGTYATFQKKKSAEIERAQVEQEFQKLEQKRQSLEERIQRLKTDRGKEEEIRRRHNVTKDGEVMIRIIE